MNAEASIAVTEPMPRPNLKEMMAIVARLGCEIFEAIEMHDFSESVEDLPDHQYAEVMRMALATMQFPRDAGRERDILMEGTRRYAALLRKGVKP